MAFLPLPSPQNEEKKTQEKENSQVDKRRENTFLGMYCCQLNVLSQ